VPCPLIPDAALGHQAAAAYAAIESVSVDELVVQRYGSILLPAQVGEQVAELLSDPRYLNGVAYAIRNDSDILPLDV
jgi:hypothetical protein